MDILSDTEKIIVQHQKDINHIELLLSTNEFIRILSYMYHPLCQNIGISVEQFFNTPFDCLFWKGPNMKCLKHKYTTVNYYKNKKNYVLQRLLYANFAKTPGKKNMYSFYHSNLKYTCKNSGSCCNINHLYIKKDKNCLLTL
ncbi:hypothetical protein nvc2_024 [Namao virus]|nr:hypothetical protein nvc2_024 [Namao virus]